MNRFPNWLLYVVLVFNCQDATGIMLSMHLYTIHFYALSKQKGYLLFMVYNWFWIFGGDFLIWSPPRSVSHCLLEQSSPVWAVRPVQRHVKRSSKSRGTAFHLNSLQFLPLKPRLAVTCCTWHNTETVRKMLDYMYIHKCGNQTQEN